MRENFYSKNILLFNGDIGNEYLNLIRQTKIVAWDIETSGLDWQKDKIGICQLFVPEKSVAIVKINQESPSNLCSLLADASIKKIFHHAMFDLQFMCFYWEVKPQNVACTKIAAKLLDRDNKIEHSLSSLLKHYMGVVVKKEETIRCSNWLSLKLTQEQISYAINDVIYLPSLLDILEKELKSKNLLELAHACFRHIPIRVQLKLLGYDDIYTYNHQSGKRDLRIELSK